GIAHRVRLFAVDFDDTCTEGDTTSLLPAAAALAADTPEKRTQIRSQWHNLTDLFLSGYTAVMAETASRPKTASGSALAPDLERLRAFLARLANEDRSSIARVVESGVLAGLTRPGLRRAMLGSCRKDWRVRPGMAATLHRAVAFPLETHVLSINWSVDVVRAILEDSLGHVDSAAVDANLDTSDGSDAGAADGGTSGAAVLAAVHGGSDNGRDTGLTVYVGDSATDLLSMLSANVGIVVGGSASFACVCAAFGVEILPLQSILHGGSDAAEDVLLAPTTLPGSRRAVYAAKGWDEIHAFLFG
ncbi:unnamed protein product, partial [Phaeothamnion confervicola]